MRLLIAIQDCDSRIMDIRAKQAAGPKRIEALRQEIETLENTLNEDLEQLKLSEHTVRETERTVEDLEDRLKKANAKLANISSNKEYKAALKEMEELKKEKMRLEDQLIDAMEGIEALKGRCKASEKDVAEGKRQFERDRDAVLKEQTVLKEELETFQDKKARFSEDIDVEIQRRYDYLREKRGGLAVTPVVKGVCQACHLGIPPQTFNELIRGDALMKCPNCSRIIYWGEDEGLQEDNLTV
ncbi:MAG: C4-type zinc ribbon domain-containing protein [Deltaproteobacteria bacterium]